MKLIHCSDIHLDSPMESNLSAQQARERNTEICSTFSRMVDYAKNNAVTAVLIAGDLFDTQRISATTSAYILDVIRQAGEVDFLYLKGNHDESSLAFSGQHLPENLKLISDRWTYFNYDFLTIAGVELTADNCTSIYSDLSLDDQGTNIVMLHGQDTTQPGVDCVCLPMLRNQHIHYLALGHLHSYRQEKLDATGTYTYCGCLEGRGFDECGEKGFVLIDAQPHHIESTFVPFAKRTLYEVPTDITNATTVTEILHAMSTAASGISSDSLVKFTLKGSYTPETQKDISFLLKMLSERYYFVKIKDESRLCIEKESYEHDISLKGEFIRTVLASNLTDEEKDAVICAGLEALRGEEISL